MNKKITEFISKYKMLPIFTIGIILRLLFVGKIPGNNNFFRDEAFSAYEAYSLNNYGMDSHGYHNPIYLKTWGSGMSAVQCHIQRVFIKVLGLTPVAVRLPQAILGCVTLVFFYLLVKEIADEKVSFWSTLVLAICPWHVTMSRWGLDCNYYIGFIVISMYLIITSRNVMWRTVLAAIFTAIALYSYASPWIVMPLLVYGTIIYLYIQKEISIKSIIVFTIILGLLASPLFIFILVNMGFINEIRGSIISIPRLSYFRSDDVHPSLGNIGTMITYFWKQFDWISYDSTKQYGTYFLFSNIFLVVGIIKSAIKHSGKSIIMWIWLICGFIMGLLIEANFERLNILFIPLIYFIGVGIVSLLDIVKKYRRIAVVAVLLVYCVSGALFAHYYFTDYNEMIARIWYDGDKQAIELAKKFDGTIHIMDIRYPLVLCYSEYPVDKYLDTVVYEDYTYKFLLPLSWEGYDLADYVGTEPVSGDVYICHVKDYEAAEWMAEQDMLYAQCGQYYVAVER